MTERLLALDLACGLGGWTQGLLAAGFDVIGIDIEPQPEYPKEAYFLKADICEIANPVILKNDIKSKSKPFWGRKVSLIVASPPCQEFSYRSFPFKRCRELAATIPPDKSIWQACERIARECNAPLVLENVRGAQKYMGQAKAHCGSFYLWGDVPPLLPTGNPRKGFQKSKTTPFNKDRDQACKNQLQCPGTSKGSVRKAWSANAAKIPFELAYHIGWSFQNDNRKRQ